MISIIFRSKTRLAEGRNIYIEIDNDTKSEEIDDIDHSWIIYSCFIIGISSIFGYLEII